jgi:uncharacterized protein
VILADTGVLFGGTDIDDPRHADCADVLEAHTGELAVVVPVIVECAWLIESRLGPSAEAGFLEAVNAGEIERLEMVEADWTRAVELIENYADLDLGLVDASIVAVAERLSVRTIATLDRRHFSVVRPAHVDGFELIP